MEPVSNNEEGSLLEILEASQDTDESLPEDVVLDCDGEPVHLHKDDIPNTALNHGGSVPLSFKAPQPQTIPSGWANKVSASPQTPSSTQGGWMSTK